MGRKIPAKKHRGVKDPLVQQAKRLASLKGKINAPPKDPDEQPVPKSLTRLFAFQDSNKRKSITKKKNHTSWRQIQDKDGNAGGAARNPVSRLRQLPGESGRGFSLRINSAVKALHSPAEQLHYPLDIEAEDEQGMRMSEQRERRARRRRRDARGAPAAGAEPRLSRTQKLALKKKAKKTKAFEASSERREVRYERVAFGDVAHAPPALRGSAPRPGKRELLLDRLLRPAAAPALQRARPPAPAALQRRERARLAAPAALQRRERARLAAVAAYRALKAANVPNK